MIWPASTKYSETLRDPFAQLMSLARLSLRPQPTGQTVLTICGYSFGDAHINSEVERALRESAGELTVVVFSYDDEPSGALKRLHEDSVIATQLRIYARKGFFHGSTQVRSEVALPWSSFETFARLLNGER